MNYSIIYIEEDIKNHPRTKKIISKFEKAKIIFCDHYKEIFNPKSQNFRLQKKEPALILAQKKGRRILPTPKTFGIGGNHNYYFSHLLNCIYDCRYCFLQGMYPSAHHVLFVNFEDFASDIKDILSQYSLHENIYFFSGYDSDSLALNPISEFVEFFIDFFSKIPNAFLELRTKSLSIGSLLKLQKINNCIIAFSFTPQEISSLFEHSVPLVSRRIKAMKLLGDKGWSLGLRFDPLIYTDNFDKHYGKLIEMCFDHLDKSWIHSISLGPLRFPEKVFQKIYDLYPQEKLLSQPFVKRKKTMTYKEELEKHLEEVILNKLNPYIDNSLIFKCHPL